MKKKIKLDAELYAKAKIVAEQAGYASVDEFISHMLEKELRTLHELGASAEQVEKQLRGLGYLA